MTCPHCYSTGDHTVLSASVRKQGRLLIQKYQLRCKGCNRGFSGTVMAETKQELAAKGVTVH